MFVRRTTNSLKSQRRTISTLANKHSLGSAPAQELDNQYFQPMDTAPETQTTQLDNGVRVVSQEAYGHLSSVNILVDAGSRYETAQTRGATHILANSLFNSTQTRSGFGVVSSLEMDGANPVYTGGRDSISVSFGVPRDRVAQPLDVVSDALANGKHSQWNLDAAIARANRKSAEVGATAFADLLHSTAFGLNNLGLPLLNNSWNSLNTDAMRAYVDATVTAPRIVVSAVGVDHNDLVAAVNKSALADLDTAPGAAAEQSSYTGGRQVVEANTNAVHAAIAFNGASWTDGNRIALGVLSTLLGGSKGMWHAGLTVSVPMGSTLPSQAPLKGPAVSLGNGSNSRLAKLANQFGGRAAAFESSYRDGGLFGVYMVTDAASANDFGQAIVAQLRESATDEEVAAAKAQLKAHVANVLDSDRFQAAHLAKQLMFDAGDAQELSAAIDAVTTADVNAAAKAALDSAATQVVFGNAQNVQSFV